MQRALPFQRSSEAAAAPHAAAGIPTGEWSSAIGINEAGDHHEVVARALVFKDSMEVLDEKLRQEMLILEMKVHGGS